MSLRSRVNRLETETRGCCPACGRERRPNEVEMVIFDVSAGGDIPEPEAEGFRLREPPPVCPVCGCNKGPIELCYEINGKLWTRDDKRPWHERQDVESERGPD